MTYHYQPIQQNETTRLQNILKELDAIVEREDKRHLMDQHLMIRTLDALKYEIIPLIDYEVNYDPTP